MTEPVRQNEPKPEQQHTCPAHMSPLEGQANESASCDRAPDGPKPATRTSHTSSARMHEAFEAKEGRALRPEAIQPQTLLRHASAHVLC